MLIFVVGEINRYTKYDWTENKAAYGPKKIQKQDFESKKENYLNKDKRAQVTLINYLSWKVTVKYIINTIYRGYLSDDYVEDEKKNCIGYDSYRMKCLY